MRMAIVRQLNKFRKGKITAFSYMWEIKALLGQSISHFFYDMHHYKACLSEEILLWP